jgi:hypothetical protein
MQLKQVWKIYSITEMSVKDAWDGNEHTITSLKLWSVTFASEYEAEEYMKELSGLGKLEELTILPSYIQVKETA